MSSGDPKSCNRPDNIKLTADDVDNLGHALLTLTNELWAVRDRLTVLEQVLEKHDLNVTEEIENFQPSEAVQEKLNTDGAALVSAVLNAMAGIDKR